MNPNNASYKQYNQHLILMALSDGQWHRNKELKEETKLTPRTLSKHLKELEKELGWIERIEDKESGEYPHPILYRIERSMLSITIFIKSVYDNADDIERELRETKDPLRILVEFHKLNLYYFTLLLESIQENKCMSQKVIDALMDFSIYAPYENYANSLMKAFADAVRFGAQFDINQLRQIHGVWDGTPKHQT